MTSKSENGLVDEISELPDDVLVDIISRLTWTEAVATSIVSTRWRSLYTYITRLSYNTRHPPEQSKDEEYVQKILQEKEFPKHTKEIYDFLASNKGCRFVEEFKVHIPCLKGALVKRWLPLVLEKEVESIDIRMICHTEGMPRFYNFPRLTMIKRKAGDLGLFPGLKSLRKLSLHSLHVDDRDVELFVSNCTVLQHLSVVGSYGLKKASLVGHSKLKHLEISSSRNVVSIEVRDMINLVSLTCYELLPKYSLLLNNVPKLVDFNSSDQFHLLGNVFPGISSSILDQLLHIDAHSKELFQIPDNLLKMPVPTLKNLKHLKLQMEFINGKGGMLLHKFPLCWKCPSLQKLEIKLLWRSFEAFDDGYHDYLIKYYKLGYDTVEPRKHLKELNLSGFKGTLVELSLLFFLIEQAVALEQFTVQLCHGTPEIRQRAESLAREHFSSSTVDRKIDLIII